MELHSTFRASKNPSQLCRTYHTVAVLLTNTYSLFYGNQSLTQFTDLDLSKDLEMPTPESHFPESHMPKLQLFLCCWIL